jgi:uncharacterized protein YcbK (DUF882 family)
MTNKQKQCLLAYLGYYTNKIDGIWGEKSRAATVALQKATGLTADGIFGANTAARIKKAVAADEFAEEKKAAASSSWWKGIKHFTREEFRCPCPRCGGFPAEPQEKLVRAADKTRDHFGKPIRVSSGVRCQAHNDELSGSVPDSRHIRGKAVDFSVEGFSSSMVLAYVQKLPEIRYAYAIDSKYVHMDIN